VRAAFPIKWGGEKLPLTATWEK